ncbi:diguanylate cyclase/phosphodiesterase with PAS/PAC sensor [Paraburkholderia caribensis MBA4]|uniref:Diguanylate cyclase/phosphodiesterase with PAS/PAC sensor n=1 Tax=Paraburkholderia caribensis MBA4 TaxID=1323664 RepID=A0A0P0RJN6_9BURK|nr:EAL domain-containing protein [Paraburkholderia caribensis]ALL68931.1 diguanylate cyclase/phosphodiesterase with PAS/PAC sensor [Paraburkholderia caribensis MBA4]
MRNRLASQPAEACQVNEEFQLYGEAHRSALESFGVALSEAAPRVVKRFYARLGSLTESRRILERLSEAELAHLEAQQIRNVIGLARGDLTADEHREMALRIGRIHATLGLDHKNLVYSRAIFERAIYSEVNTELHAEALTVLNQRFARDLAIQTEVYKEVQSARSELLLSIVRITSEADSYAHLMDGVVGAIGQLKEVAGCTAGRPDADGSFRWEVVGGTQLLDYFQHIEADGLSISTQSDHPLGQGPIGCAFRSGETNRSINTSTDLRVAPWRDHLIEHGFRSVVAIPLSRIGETPQAVLCLYSALPGGFSGADQQDFIALVQMLLGLALTRIEHAEGGTHTVPFLVRQRWSELLRSDGLQMHYQPILNLKTREVEKVEALARLDDGSRLLAPGQFLPTFSRDDLLELFVRGLEQALSQRNSWLREGVDLSISVNLPPCGLSDGRYLEATRQVLARHACDPAALTLEVLETEEVQAAQSSQGILRYKELGVMLAQDDLGSGHSSLNRLRVMPFDCIKIDREIVRLDGNDNSDILRFVYQLTRLAHSLGKTVVVEGVEDEGMIDALVVLGADLIQGYGIARPMPAGQVAGWMKNNTALSRAEPPVSRLGKLARLLIWEETQHLNSEVRNATSACLFPDSSIALDCILPSLSRSPAKHALLEAVAQYGVDSERYQSARRSLVAEI